MSGRRVATRVELRNRKFGDELRFRGLRTDASRGQSQNAFRAGCGVRLSDQGLREERKRTMALADPDIAIKAFGEALSQRDPAARRWRFDPVEWELVRSDPAAPRWIVLHTRSRQEKAVSELLQAHGFETFLPLVTKVRFYGHRKRTVEIPLFPSYLFLWGPLEAMHPAIASKRAVGAVRTENQGLLDRELLNLKLALESGAGLDPYPFLERGRPVRVTAGPFKGIEGVIEDRRSRDRLILQIYTLGRATALEIDPSLLEPLD